MLWKWPLLNYIKESLPINSFDSGHQGAFGAKRLYDVHTGIDLYAPVGQPVCAVEEGVVVAVIEFTGEKANSPWWLDTKAVLVKGETGTVVYGEIDPLDYIKEDTIVTPGTILGYVQRVLKKDKGLPTSMLHLELYFETVKDTAIWKLNESRPKGLLNPTSYLENTVFYQEFLEKNYEQTR